MKRIETVDIVQSLVNSINLTFTATSIVDLTGGFYQLTTCDTMHLQACNFTLTIDGNDYFISEVIKDTSITISGEVLPTSLSFEVYPPFYIYGTILETKNETDKIMDSVDKTPMIFLLTSITDNFKGAEEMTDRISPLRIFFLTQADWDNDNTKDLHSNAVNPMLNLAHNFVDVLKNSPMINNANTLDYSITGREKFANYFKGSYTTALFDKNLTGCELSFDLDVRKNFECFCT
jgi:hypothetical protein